MELEHNVPKEHVELAASKMGREPINPIGSCFDATAHQLIFGEEPPKDIKLFHGIGTANMPGQEGQKMGHAWLEWTVNGKRAAYDTTWGVLTNADHYRKTLQIEYEISFTRAEFYLKWKETNYPGPWDERIRKITEKEKDESNT